jgi:hypothetical protein
MPSISILFEREGRFQQPLFREPAFVLPARSSGLMRRLAVPCMGATIRRLEAVYTSYSIFYSIFGRQLQTLFA